MERAILIFVILKPKLDKILDLYIYGKIWLCAFGFALVYCANVNGQENRISAMEMLQSNIYYYARIKTYIVHAQKWLQKTPVLGYSAASGSFV